MKTNKERKARRLSLITDFILFSLIIIVAINILKNTGIIDKLRINSFNGSGYYDNVKNENELYIRKLKKEYGINILYGSDTDRIIKSVNANKQYDENIVNSNLKEIYAALSKYPDEVFKVFKNKEYPLYVILVDKFNDDNIAIASRNKLNEVKIYISNDKKFERAFHHELFHILEYYMNDKNPGLYSEWASLNPKNFEYAQSTANLNKEYVYPTNSSAYASSSDNNYSTEYTEVNHLLNTVGNTENDTVKVDNNYFVTKYAKTNEKEDRAETFTELMIMERLPKFFYKGTNIRKKADYILDGIKKNITENELYCNKILNKDT